jgi:uncharacterized membrane protein
MIAAFFVASLYGGIVAYYNLAIASAHAYDLAIFQQALSSTAQGYHVPFYESTDCLVKGRCSFLLVHPSLVLAPLVPLYGAFPTPVTLFAVRSAVVALAALPLYFVARHASRSDEKGLVAAGLYLLWAPTLSGDLYSFHVESFVPLEMFTLVALWQVGRYRWGLAAAAVSFVTIEAAPVFALLIGLYFLSPTILGALGAARRRWREGAGAPARLRSAWNQLAQSTRSALRGAEVRYALALVAFSAVAYVAVVLFMNLVGPALLGVPTPPPPGGFAGVLANNSQNGETLNFAAVAASPALGWTVAYWLILYGLVGFIPLLHPRSFVIVGAPWIAYTLFNTVHRFSTIGSQYTLLAAVPVFLGVAYGLARVPFRSAAAPAPSARPTEPGGTSPTPFENARRRARGRTVATGGVAVFGVLVVANLLLNPMVPVVPLVAGKPGGPFNAYYYEPSLTVQPGFSWVEHLVDLIPADSVVGVTLNLFPLVANDLYSYEIRPLAGNYSGLPFNYSQGPSWVLTTAVGGTSGGRTLDLALADPSVYQLRGYVATSTVGPVLLYERGYIGPAELFGPPGSPSAHEWTPTSGLVVGPVGVQAANSTAPGGNVVETNRTSPGPGTMCRVDVGFLVPAAYVLSAEVARQAPVANETPNEAVLQIRVLEQTGLVWETNVTASQLPPGQWTVLSFPFVLSGPAVSAQVFVNALGDRAPFAVASLALGPNT